MFRTNTYLGAFVYRDLLLHGSACFGDGLDNRVRVRKELH
jgi:hypothetical protein